MTSELEQSQRLTELQSCLGKALWQIQAFEDTLAHLIAVVLKMPARASLEKAEAILEKVQGNTLGRLISETKKVIHFDVIRSTHDQISKRAELARPPQLANLPWVSR